ncbi:hypothetical protein [Tepidiforma sp.]|uniref:hypothetical protein n=1 Tax=Tepidiforma sp. TaxID=2682230 RepID=UPI002ADDFC71|nr:hypothetical protein [Tepidiforma sp.]
MVVVLLESISFAIGRELGGGDGAPPAAAASTPTPGAATSPGATATPAAPEVDPCTGLSLNPDTTQPFGAIPYRDRDRELPLFDGVIAGLRIGPDADAGVDQLPKCSKTRWGTLEEASGSPLELPLTLPMPAFRAVGFSQVVICEGDGLPLGVVVDYAFGAYSEVGRYGGSLSVSRTRVEPRGGLPVVSMLLPAPRVREMEIAGGPAAVAVPILPDHGAGTAAVVTYRDGIITVIQGNAPIGLLLEVSEYILRGEW